MNGCTNFNETSVSCLEHLCVQKDLFTSVDSLHKNKFSTFNSINSHYIYNSITSIIGIDIE
jgi:hypothetical protein